MIEKVYLLSLEEICVLAGLKDYDNIYFFQDSTVSLKDTVLLETLQQLEKAGLISVKDENFVLSDEADTVIRYIGESSELLNISPGSNKQSPIVCYIGNKILMVKTVAYNQRKYRLSFVEREKLLELLLEQAYLPEILADENLQESVKCQLSVYIPALEWKKRNSEVIVLERIKMGESEPVIQIAITQNESMYEMEIYQNGISSRQMYSRETLDIVFKELLD